MSRIAAKLQADDLTFERLEVDASVALRMFEDNRFAKIFFFCLVYLAAAVYNAGATLIITHAHCFNGLC